MGCFKASWSSKNLKYIREPEFAMPSGDGEHSSQNQCSRIASLNHSSEQIVVPVFNRHCWLKTSSTFYEVLGRKDTPDLIG